MHALQRKEQEDTALSAWTAKQGVRRMVCCPQALGGREGGKEGGWGSSQESGNVAEQAEAVAHLEVHGARLHPRTTPLPQITPGEFASRLNKKGCEKRYLKL